MKQENFELCVRRNMNWQSVFHKCNGMGNGNEQDLCKPSLFFVCLGIRFNTSILFPNKRLRRDRVKLLNYSKGQYSLLLQYGILEKLVTTILIRSRINLRLGSQMKRLWTICWQSELIISELIHISKMQNSIFTMK